MSNALLLFFMCVTKYCADTDVVCTSEVFEKYFCWNLLSVFADWDGSLSRTRPMKQAEKKINKFLLLIYTCCTTRHNHTETLLPAFRHWLQYVREGSIFSLEFLSHEPRARRELRCFTFFFFSHNSSESVQYIKASEPNGDICINTRWSERQPFIHCLADLLSLTLANGR